MPLAQQENLKLVVRNLPPSLPAEKFTQACSDEFGERIKWSSFTPGKDRCRFWLRTVEALELAALHASCDGDTKSICNDLLLPMNRSAKTKRSATAYVKLGNQADVLDFKAAFDGRQFGEKRCSSAQVSVEYAPLQRVPGSKIKRDPRENTIEQGAGRSDSGVSGTSLCQPA